MDNKKQKRISCEKCYACREGVFVVVVGGDGAPQCRSFRWCPTTSHRLAAHRLGAVEFEQARLDGAAQPFKDRSSTLAVRLLAETVKQDLASLVILDAL